MKPQNEILILTCTNDSSLNNWAESIGRHIQSSIYELFKKEVLCVVLNLETVAKTKPDKPVVVVFDNLTNPDNDFKQVTEMAAANSTFLVYKKPISALPITNVLPELPSYLFCDIDPETGLDRNFDPKGNLHESRLYWAKVLDIAFDLGSLLFAAKPLTESQKVVYLAECTPDQFENRDAVRSELVHRGFKVVPPHFLKGGQDELTVAISNYLEKSDISVHIIGNHYGDHIKGSDVSLIELQCRLAAKHWRVSSTRDDGKQFQRVVWLPPGLKPSDERQRRFVALLRNEDKDAYSEIMQVPVEDLKTSLYDKISSIDQNFSHYKNQKQSVYIIYEKKDFDKITALRNFFEQKNVKANYIDFSSNRESMVSQHFAYLASSDSVIICDFGSNSHWITSKLKDLVKAPGVGRTKPFEIKAVYTHNKNRFKSLEAGLQCLVLEANNDTEKALIPFTTKINLK